MMRIILSFLILLCAQFVDGCSSEAEFDRGVVQPKLRETSQAFPRSSVTMGDQGEHEIGRAHV